tara:strand:- start:367 stop:1278 length:912 start_codon:yes stop_codon:yes gene_type:complete
MIATKQISDKIRSEFNFEVNRLPLYGPDNMHTKWYGLFRSDNGKTVGPGSVSEYYTPHTVDHIVEIAEAAIGSFGEASDVCCHFKNGHYVSIAPTAEYRKSVVGNDTVWPRLVISAGLGGSTSFNLKIGYYRDLCRNLAMMRSVKSFNIRYRHTSGLNDRLDTLVEDFQGLKDGWEDLSSLIDKMNRRTVVISEIIKEVYGDLDDNPSRRQRTIGENRIQKIVVRLMKERQTPNLNMAPGTATAWELYNAIQGYHQHDAPTRAKRGDRPAPPTPSRRASQRWDRIISTAANTSVAKAEQLLAA